MNHSFVQALSRCGAAVPLHIRGYLQKFFHSLRDIFMLLAVKRDDT